MNHPPKLSSYLLTGGSLFFAVIASGLIFFSSQKQSLTVDEPNHLYCGMEWLQEGTYTAWPENPPLSRIIVAIGPYLNGHSIGKIPTENKTVFELFLAAGSDFSYFTPVSLRENLFWMRIFVLPMFLLSVWIVWFWARRLGGNGAGFLAAAMYALLPSILAHSGLATTDITFLALFTLTLFCLSRWISKPDLVRGAVLGLSLGATLLTKYSVLAFFPVAALLMLVIFFLFGLKESGRSFRQWGIMALRSGVLSAMVAFLCIWAFFGFSIGTLGDQPTIQAGIREGLFSAGLAKVMLPAPEWFTGLQLLAQHNEEGHLTYLAGNIATHGFWNFYPLAFLIKTPLPFLIFLLIGIAGAWLNLDNKESRNWEAMALVLLPFAIILSGLSSNINIGLRHVIIIYSLGAVGAAAGFLRILNYGFSQRKQWKIVLPSIFVVWQFSIAVLAFPMYLSYFNPLAGEEPGELLMDSDLDWGQGMFELADYCKENNIQKLNLSYFGLAQDCWYGLPATTLLPPDSLAEGWVAVSEMAYRGVWTGVSANLGDCNLFAFRPMFSQTMEPGKGYKWLDKFPLKAKLGGSIRVYYVEKGR